MGFAVRRRYHSTVEMATNRGVWLFCLSAIASRAPRCGWMDHPSETVTATPTGGGAAVNSRAHQATACPTAMMPLSTDWTALNAKIDAMTPTGNTNVTMGMQ